MKMLVRFAVFAIPVYGISLLAAGSPPPAGTWKLNSEKVMEGEAPSFPRDVVMRTDGSSRPVKFDKPLPASVVGQARMKVNVSPDGQTLTLDTTGVDAKSGKPYRYVLLWEKQ